MVAYARVGEFRAVLRRGERQHRLVRGAFTAEDKPRTTAVVAAFGEPELDPATRAVRTVLVLDRIRLQEEEREKRWRKKFDATT